MSRSSPSTKAATPRLHLYLLGSFRVENNTDSIRLPTRKIESLLAFLALHSEPHSREKLASLFWGDVSDAQARGSLRKALTLLRKHLSDDILLADRDTVQLNPEFPLSVDVREFLQTANHRPPTAASALASAVALYRGDLLPDFYDDWIPPERERLRGLFLELLLQGVEAFRASSEYDRAIEWAQKILESDPANERAHQHLMFCYVATGNRQAALEQYEKCKRALQEELAAELSSETIAVFEWVKHSATEPTQIAARITNLPIPLSSFIGRKREMQQVKQLLLNTRLLTLTGAGGSGKTRLAIQVATELIDSFKQGVWWVDLAALSSAELVPQTVAKALGVQQVPNQSLTETLTYFLHSKQLLLALDNCEHLITACAQLAEYLLSACPDLKIVATSREMLGVPGEVAWMIPQLSLPDTQQKSPLEEYEAIQLFVARTNAVKIDFALTEKNAPSVTQICQRLEGIPLAIELAAARMKVLSVEHIAERLDDRFDLLTDGSRTALPRHQTLRATIDWSYDLLPEDAQLLMRRLAVFAGGFILEAAERVCTDEQLKSHAVLDLLTRLVDRSLVIVEEQGESERYRMLETIREYARDKLEQAGEVEPLRSRHLDYFVELVGRAESEWYGPKRLEWFKCLEIEHDNFNAALESSLTLPDALERGLRLGGVLGEFWAWRTHKAEGRYWLEKLLAASRERGIGSAASLAKLLGQAAALAYERVEWSTSRQLLEESAGLAREVNDQRSLGFALLWLGMVVGHLGESDAGSAFVDESVDVFRNVGDKWGLGYALGHRGRRLGHEGHGYPFGRDRGKALEDIYESLALLEELGDRWTIEIPLGSLSDLKMVDGEYAEARALQERSIQAARELENEFGVAVRLMALAGIWRAEGNYEQAEALYAQAHEMWERWGNERFALFTMTDLAAMAVQLGNLARASALLVERLRFEIGREHWIETEMLSICEALVSTARIWVAGGQPRRAAQLLGAAAERLEKMIIPKTWQGEWQVERAEYERAIATIRAQIDEEAFAVAWSEGRQMTLEQAIDFALASL